MPTAGWLKPLLQDILTEKPPPQGTLTEWQIMVGWAVLIFSLSHSFEV